MRVLIAEDDSLHRSFLASTLRELLAEAGEIREVADGEAAIRSARDWRPHGIVLDLQMPRATGIHAARAIWADDPDARILFWSNYADESYVRGVAKIVPQGAIYGYVLKSASEDRLRFAIRGVFIEGQCLVDAEVSGVQLRGDNERGGLTDVEYEILNDLALGLTDKAISMRRSLSVRSVQGRLQQLYSKLGLDHDAPETDRSLLNYRTRALLIALERGLLNVESLRHADRELVAWLAQKAQSPVRR